MIVGITALKLYSAERSNNDPVDLMVRNSVDRAENCIFKGSRSMEVKNCISYVHIYHLLFNRSTVPITH